MYTEVELNGYFKALLISVNLCKYNSNLRCIIATTGLLDEFQSEIKYSIDRKKVLQSSEDYIILGSIPYCVAREN
mgnify:CR=1 FL=1